MPTEPDDIGKWALNSIEPKCQQPDRAESSPDEYLEYVVFCWLNEDKPIGEEVDALRPYLYGELRDLFGKATAETDNRCVEDILTEAERLMQATHLPTDHQQQLSPMAWKELLQPADQKEHCRKLNGHHQRNHHNTHENIERRLVSDNGTGEYRAGPRAPSDAPATSSPGPTAMGNEQWVDRAVPVVDDRTTQPSPAADDAAANSWRLLMHRIGELEDCLKDMEERYKGAKLQLDALSVEFRITTESYRALQQENKELQLEVRNTTKCNDLLRSQLQEAQYERDAAIELQMILKTKLNVARTEQQQVQDGKEKDRQMIQDLQRQCREMERILIRKYPDNVSTLIVGCKTKDDLDGSANRLEQVQRIVQLKADAKRQDETLQDILDGVPDGFNSVKARYNTHIADLEMQVLNLQEINTKLSEQIIRLTQESASVVAPLPVTPPPAITTTKRFTQTEAETDVKAVQTDGTGPSEPAATVGTRQLPTRKRIGQTGTAAAAATSMASRPAPGKENAHLVATIRGMQTELANKEKSVQRLTRELDESKKAIRKLQCQRRDR